jgi:hypothetical protein
MNFQNISVTVKHFGKLGYFTMQTGGTVIFATSALISINIVSKFTLKYTATLSNYFYHLSQNNSQKNADESISNQLKNEFKNVCIILLSFGLGSGLIMGGNKLQLLLQI